MLEVVISDHSKDDVNDAITQFVARRSYRLSRPWYLEDIRIEAPQLNQQKKDESKGFWSSLVEYPAPYVDVEVKKRRRGAKVIIKPSSHDNSPLIGYDLQAFLYDQRVYESVCPPVCPRCANGVPNPGSHYCGRCGHQLLGGGSTDREDADERGDVLAPGGMMYENAPLITPEGLPENERRADDVLLPPPAVELDEFHDDPIAIERVEGDLGIEPALEQAQSEASPQAPVAIERDAEIAESGSEDDEKVTEVADGDKLETHEERPDSTNAVESATEEETVAMTTPAEAEAETTAVDEETIDDDDDEEPPFERRMLAED